MGRFFPWSCSIPWKVTARMNKGTSDNEGPGLVPFVGTYLPDCAAFVHLNQSANKFLLPYPVTLTNRWSCKKKKKRKGLTSAIGWKVVSSSITMRLKKRKGTGRRKIIVKGVKWEKGGKKRKRPLSFTNDGIRYHAFNIIVYSMIKSCGRMGEVDCLSFIRIIILTEALWSLK